MRIFSIITLNRVKWCFQKLPKSMQKILARISLNHKNFMQPHLGWMDINNVCKFKKMISFYFNILAYTKFEPRFDLQKMQKCKNQDAKINVRNAKISHCALLTRVLHWIVFHIASAITFWYCKLELYSPSGLICMFQHDSHSGWWSDLCHTCHVKLSVTFKANVSWTCIKCWKFTNTRKKIYFTYVQLTEKNPREW